MAGLFGSGREMGQPPPATFVPWRPSGGGRIIGLLRRPATPTRPDTVDPLLLPVATAFALGAVHAFDPDHVAAVTAFVSRRPRPGEAVGFGVRWGLGHSAAILLVGVLLIALDVRIPPALDAGLELVVGVVLVGLGVWLLRELRRTGPAPRRAGRTGTVWVGVIHGLAGTAALLALLPVTLIASPLHSAAYLASFGAGTVTAMAAYGLAAGWLFRRAGRVHPRWTTGIRAAAATASVVIGAVWIGAVVF